jgi:hypothetical protein
MGKYDLIEICNTYGVTNFGDKDLKPEYQNLVKILFMEKQTNELAEANRLKRLELRMRAIENKEIRYHFSDEIDELEDLA